MKNVVVTTVIWTRCGAFLAPSGFEHVKVSIPPSLQRSRTRATYYAYQKVEKSLTLPRRTWMTSHTLADAKRKAAELDKAREETIANENSRRA